MAYWKERGPLKGNAITIVENSYMITSLLIPGILNNILLKRPGLAFCRIVVNVLNFLKRNLFPPCISLLHLGRE